MDFRAVVFSFGHKLFDGRKILSFPPANVK